MLGATRRQHQGPEQKQLLGAPHGLCFRMERPSPQDGLKRKAQPWKSLCRSRLEPVPLVETVLLAP